MSQLMILALWISRPEISLFFTVAGFLSILVFISFDVNLYSEWLKKQQIDKKLERGMMLSWAVGFLLIILNLLSATAGIAVKSNYDALNANTHHFVGISGTLLFYISLLFNTKRWIKNLFTA